MSFVTLQRHIVTSIWKEFFVELDKYKELKYTGTIGLYCDW